MTTINLFKRFAKKDRKKNPDWSRIEEPDEIVKPMLIGIIGIVIAAFSMMTAWNVMTTSPTVWIATFLASLNSPLPFPQLYATFASAVIVMIDLFVTTIYIFFNVPGNEDVIEMISDLDSNIQERIVELENGLNQKIDAIKNDI